MHNDSFRCWSISSGSNTDLIRDPPSYLFRIASNVLFEFELKRKASLVWLSRRSDEHLPQPRRFL
jgi:hypothetical protein